MRAKSACMACILSIVVTLCVIDTAVGNAEVLDVHTSPDAINPEAQAATDDHEVSQSQKMMADTHQSDLVVPIKESILVQTTVKESSDEDEDGDEYYDHFYGEMPRKDDEAHLEAGQKNVENVAFFSYMTHWWQNNRKWMKSHNLRLYEKLREHRALSISTLWKPFLLKWHYVQPRLKQGYRYTWNDDGTYTTKRFLMKSSRRKDEAIVAARIRSVNNICFPGLLPEKRKKLWCTYDKRVSARAVQFTLEHSHSAPTLSMLRAYTSFVPKNGMHIPVEDAGSWTKAKPAVSFVSVQGLHWSILEMIEYCDVPSDDSGASVPVAYRPHHSTPKRAFSLEFMEWLPIKMGRSQLDTGATVEQVELKTKDEKIKILCVVPVSNPQSIDGSEIKLTQEKCSFYIRQWDFNLKCPDGKKGSLAMATKVTARSDGGQNEEPTLTPSFKGQLSRNRNKVSMQFEQQAVLHVESETSESNARHSVPVIMSQSEKMQWTADPRFRSSRNLYFSFIVSDTSKIKTGSLNWDPEMEGHFKSKPEILKTNVNPVGKTSGSKPDNVDINSINGNANEASSPDGTISNDVFVQQMQQVESTGCLTAAHSWFLILQTLCLVLMV